MAPAAGPLLSCISGYSLHISLLQLDVPGYPGQIVANIGPLRTNVTFDHRDCSVTLLKNDHVLINLLINTLTNKRRAANIRPKIPFTFRYTKEVREQVPARRDRRDRSRWNRC